VKKKKNKECFDLVIIHIIRRMFLQIRCNWYVVGMSGHTAGLLHTEGSLQIVVGKFLFSLLHSLFPFQDFLPEISILYWFMFSR
jgi:hypothetical protein